MGIVVLKNTISEVNSLRRINSRLEPESEGFNKFVAKSVQNIQTKAQEWGREGITGMSTREMWNMVIRSCTHLTGVPERECRESETEAIFEKIMAVNFTNPKNEKKETSTDSRTSVNPNKDNFKENRTKHIPV